MESKINDTNELIYKTEIDSQTNKTKLQLPKGMCEEEEEINQELGINIYTLLYIKQINNKDLLHSARNYTQYLIITYSGKESKKEYVYVHIYVYIYIYIYIYI